MEIVFSRNSTGWWTVGIANDLPIGSISEDGAIFRPAQYAGLSIDFAVMKEIVALMDKIKNEEVIESAKLRITV